MARETRPGGPAERPQPRIDAAGLARAADEEGWGLVETMGEPFGSVEYEKISHLTKWDKLSHSVRQVDSIAETLHGPTHPVPRHFPRAPRPDAEA